MGLDPIIVIGPPRSGTTMTAKVLQNWFGVLMDGVPMRPDKIINPYGWYEDKRLVEANMLFLNGNIHIRAWARRFKRFIRAMEKLNCPWGFKDPRIIPLFGYALSFFKSPIIIRCHRPKKMVVKSYIEKLKWSKQGALSRYDSDEKLLDKFLAYKTYYKIDFKDYVSEEQILAFLQDTEIIRYAA